jgi:pilus assembly protein Flp/PilA
MLVAKFKHFLTEDSGATAIEYGLLAALIAVGAIAGFTAFGGGLQGLFEHVDSKTSEAVTKASGSL